MRMPILEKRIKLEKATRVSTRNKLKLNANIRNISAVNRREDPKTPTVTACTPPVKA